MESIITTPANCSDSFVLPDLIEKSKLKEGVSVLAYKGYDSSKMNSACLKKPSLVTGIIFKVQRGRS